jgi:hypothetical protein
LLIGRCGIGEDRGEILIAYPAVELEGIELNQIVSLCLPTGLNRAYLRRSNGNIIEDEFIFVINREVSPIYGVCLHVIPRVSSFFCGNRQMNDTFAFCFLTRRPVMNAHFQFLSYLIYASLGSVHIYRFSIPTHARFRAGRLLRLHPIDDEICHERTIEVPSFFGDGLKFYEFTGPSTPPLFLGSDIEIHFPPHSDTKMILYYTLDTIFSILSVSDIVLLVGALMMDCTIIVIGSSLKEVSHTILSLQYLIEPCRYSGMVVPIVPCESDFMTLLDSPTPMIVGVAPCPALFTLTFLDTSIFVNLDRRIVTSSSFPSYPNHEHIVRTLETIIDKERSHAPHPFGYPAVLRRDNDHEFSFSPTTADQIVKVLQEPLWQLLTDFVYCFFVSDMTSSSDGTWITVFNSALFLGQVDAKESEFFRWFVESQTFELYIEERISEYLTKKHADGRIGMVGQPSAPGERRTSRRRTKSIDQSLLTAV